MVVRARYLVIGLLAFIACFLLQRRPVLWPALSNVPSTSTGIFPLNGEFAGQPLAYGESVRRWGSYGGADANTGHLQLGPFAASNRLRIAVSGYPTVAGNGLYFQRGDTGEKFAVPTSDPGESWRVVDVLLPSGWKGHSVTLHAIDGSKQVRGWLGVTEPLRGGRGEGNTALLTSVACLLLNGLLLLVLWSAAMRLVMLGTSIPAHWAPLVAAGGVAAAGYAVFWAYFAAPWLGKAASVLAIFGSGVVVARRARTTASSDPSPIAALMHARSVLIVMGAIALFYIATLHLFPSSLPFYDLAANRFRESLPVDNVLPHNVTVALYDNQNLRPDGGDWLTSDRPPLQTGWQLLTFPATELLGLDRQSATGTSAIWLQLLWVPAVYGLFISLGVARHRAVQWLAVLAITGFFAQNTVFTWPKLSAAAFACGAVALWFLDPPRPTPVRLLIGAALAGLAWLSHGGVAFSFLALAPGILSRIWRGESRMWAAAGVLFLCFATPWFAFQKFYDPPGDRLIKMHLGGQPEKDTRSAAEVIRSAYATRTGSEIITNKLSNFRILTFGSWSDLIDVRQQTSAHRRDDEFFLFFRALTWWAFAPLALVAALILPTRRAALCRTRAHQAMLLGWTALTLVLWGLLMFGPYTTVIHQGSYATLLVLFVLSSLWLDALAAPLVWLVGALQTVTFVTTWAWANGHVQGTPSGWPFVALGAIGLLAIFVLGAGPDSYAAAAHDGPRIPKSLLRLLSLGRAATARVCRAYTERPALFHWGAAAISVGLIILHKPWALHTPQLWAEDGSVFLNDAEQHGIRALFLSYQGYLHLIPRLIVWVSNGIADVRWWPLLYNLGSLVVAGVVLARMASARFAVPQKAWLLLSIGLVAQSGEVLLNVTNVQWVAALLLVIDLMLERPATSAQLAGDAVILVLCGLTGPFAIVVLPLFAWRAWQSKSPADRAKLIALAAAAMVQAWIFLHTPPVATAPRPDNFDLVNFAAVTSARLAVWPLLGRSFVATQAPALLALLGFGFAVVVVWRVARTRRSFEFVALAACALLLVATSWRARPDGWSANDLVNGDRYFFLQRVLLVWVVIWQFSATTRWVALSARALCVVGALAELGTHASPAPDDYHWAEHCAPIREGKPAEIPILPDAWILQYPGRPSYRP